MYLLAKYGNDLPLFKGNEEKYVKQSNADGKTNSKP